MTQPSDRWRDGAAYEAFIGRWSRVVAAEFVPWLGLGPGLDWVDVGCGTGVLTRAILGLAAPRSVTGVDPSVPFLEAARRTTADERASFVEGAGGSLPLEAGSADAVVAGLVLNFVPDPVAALADMRRVVRPDGTVAAYVWDYAGEMQLMISFWAAAVSVDPAAEAIAEGQRFPIARREALVAAVSAAGLRDAEVTGITIPTVFRDFDDYWVPFTGATGPAPAYVASLSTDRREALRAALDRTLPRAADGTIPLHARAWAVRGRR
jgi:SAM-dependent methyltransferase